MAIESCYTDMFRRVREFQCHVQVRWSTVQAVQHRKCMHSVLTHTAFIYVFWEWYYDFSPFTTDIHKLCMLALCAQHSKQLPCLEFGMYVTWYACTSMELQRWAKVSRMHAYSVKVLRTLRLKNRIIVNVLDRCELYAYMCTKVHIS